MMNAGDLEEMSIIYPVFLGVKYHTFKTEQFFDSQKIPTFFMSQSKQEVLFAMELFLHIFILLKFLKSLPVEGKIAIKDVDGEHLLFAEMAAYCGKSFNSLSKSYKFLRRISKLLNEINELSVEFDGVDIRFRQSVKFI